MERMTRWLAILTIAACGSSNKLAPDAGVVADGPPAHDAALDARADAALPHDAAPDAPPDAAAMPHAPSSHISVGVNYSCAIHTDGTLWCWGSPLSTAATAVTVPTQVGTSTTWTAIAAGITRTCGIDNGALYCWGYNSDNALGTGDSVDHPTPVLVGTATDWTNISEGYRHACALREGALYCWGYNTYGEAGTGTLVSTPTQLGTDTDWYAVAAGKQITCGLRGTAQAHTLWCWGDGSSGGNGTVQAQATPQQVGTATDWIVVAANPEYGQACAQKADGTAWCWGSGFQVTPSQLGTWSNVSSVGLGSVLCAIHGSTLSCRGAYKSGAIGAGNGSQLAATSFVDLTGTWKEVASHVDHGCAIDMTDHVQCWGANAFGKLGLGTMPDRPTYSRVGTQTWSYIGMTMFNDLTCGLSGTGLYCWGGPSFGLGNNTGLAEQTPYLVGTGYIDIKVGFEGGCARKADHTLWCWGRGQYFGQQDTYVPNEITVDTDWDDYAIDQMACGIRAGALYCWGPNFYGQVGDGTTTTRTTPTRIGTDTTWTAIATNQYDTCGVDAGQLYCWGYRVNSHTPKAVTNGASWSTIAMDSGGYACGLRTDQSWWCAVNGNAAVFHTGTDWAWADTYCGVKTSGALYCHGAQVGSATDWVKTSSTAVESCGIHTDGSLTCMGPGHLGELGNGDAWVLVPTPTQ
jgi:alpha-tubulin suppressor-like RCC1 family protein